MAEDTSSPSLVAGRDVQEKEDVMDNDVVQGNAMLLLTVALIMISGEPVHITTSAH